MANWISMVGPSQYRYGFSSHTRYIGSVLVVPALITFGATHFGAFPQFLSVIPHFFIKIILGLCAPCAAHNERG